MKGFVFEGKRDGLEMRFWGTRKHGPSWERAAKFPVRTDELVCLPLARRVARLLASRRRCAARPGILIRSFRCFESEMAVG